jgi:hypothetical protein
LYRSPQPLWHAQALPFAVFSAGIDAHWETKIRTVWNARECTAEDHELVYEVSWMSELGAWRRFLRSQRMVKSEAEGWYRSSGTSVDCFTP